MSDTDLSMLDDRLRLRSSLLVEVWREDADCVAASPCLQTHGFGDDVASARRDLQRAIAEEYYTLRDHADSDRLSPRMRALWHEYQAAIVEVAPKPKAKRSK